MLRKPFVLLLCACCGYASADDADQFSRANCFNNESITYNYFDPPQLRGVISHHFDTENGDLVHYAGHNDPAMCFNLGFPPPPGICPVSLNPSTEDALCTPVMTCLWFATTETRHAAIHNFTDGGWFGAGVGDRWRTEGKHTYILGYYYGYPIFIIQNTGPEVDCNLHFSQLY